MLPCGAAGDGDFAISIASDAAPRRAIYAPANSVMPEKADGMHVSYARGGRREDGAQEVEARDA